MPIKNGRGNSRLKEDGITIQNEGYRYLRWREKCDFTAAYDGVFVV